MANQRQQSKDGDINMALALRLFATTTAAPLTAISRGNTVSASKSTTPPCLDAGSLLSRFNV